MSCDHEMMARVVSYQADLMALEADVKGMEAENANRERRGESQAYAEKDFRLKAAEMRGVASALGQIGWGR